MTLAAKRRSNVALTATRSIEQSLPTALDRLRVVVDDEAGHAVLHDLRDGAAAPSDHGAVP